MASPIKTNSSNAYNLKVLTASNDVNDILKMISPRWKMQILCSISTGVNQFSRLKEMFPSLSDQVLGKRLAELVNEGLLLKKHIAATVPQQTVYIHTAKAAALLEILLQLHLWGQKKWEEEG
jgi:DNA-binding HxlR family transcriptional regulator